MEDFVVSETVHHVRTKGNQSIAPTTIVSYNIRSADNERIDKNQINSALNQLNEEIYVDDPAVEISYQVAVREPVFATTSKFPASNSQLDFMAHTMYYYDEFDGFDGNNTYSDFIIRVYITNTSGQGDDETKSHCFYEALRKLHVFHTSHYKTYHEFIEQHPQLPQDGSVSLNDIPFIEQKLFICISVSGDDSYNSKFTDRYNQHCYLTLKNNHYDLDKKPSKRPGMKRIFKFKNEMKLMIVHDDDNSVFTFDGETLNKNPIEYKDGNKMKGNFKGCICEQLNSIKKLYDIKSTKLEEQMREGYNYIKKDYDELNEITEGEFNIYNFVNLSSMIKFMAYKYAGRTHINDITEPTELYEYHRLEKATKGGFVDIHSKDKRYKDGYSYDFVSAYPSILNSYDFHVPVKKGTLTYLDPKYFNPNKELKYGLYNCKILNPKKPNIYFIFNESNWYTHFDIKLALLQGLDIQLIDSPNNLIYWNIKSSWQSKKPAQAIQADKIFSEYIFKLHSLKSKHPNNKILKSCLSGLWGRLCEIDKSYKISNPKEDIIIEDDELFNEIKYSDSTKIEFTVINKSNPYTSNYARMKPFLLAKQRLNMYERVFAKYKDTHTFLRIMVDGFITDKPIKEFDKNKKYLEFIVKDREYHDFHTPNKSIICPNKHGKLCKCCSKQ